MWSMDRTRSMSIATVLWCEECIKTIHSLTLTVMWPFLTRILTTVQILKFLCSKISMLK